MSQSQRPKKKKKKSTNSINFTTVVFLLIFIYLAVQIFISFSKDKIGIYEVEAATKSSVVSSYDGLITRDETIVTLPDRGYINYYIREGDKTGVGNTIYSIDETGDYARELAEKYKDATSLSASSLSMIKETLVESAIRTAGNDLSAMYSDKVLLSSIVFDSFYLSASNDINETNDNITFTKVSADRSGFVLFQKDAEGLEGLKPEDIVPDTFKMANNIVIKQSGELQEKGDFAYKLVRDDSFTITFPITEADAKAYQDKKYIRIYLEKANVSVNGAFSITTASDDEHTLMGHIELSKYGSLYLKDRHIAFRIAEANVEGFKIPTTAVINKDFYVVPKDYLTKAGDANVVLKQVFHEDGTTSIEQVAVSVYATIEDDCYILADSINTGDYIVKPDSQERYPIARQEPLQGVYNVNQGYCQFKKIEIITLTADGGYYIVSPTSTYGINAYDHIVLNANLVVESQIIY